ncbi:bacitracin ABC transporter ATP-binding protein [Virgibacillus profundi]|uniref:Bacitracin ABC transporter ATP-binding protein n=1 Tax=Virgibacillus profundi TaxID=2024555 RepID=A0A2A2IF80_9BACI|nr:ABC transporter ATP-binding protein [Virgibacillus profundi]PAV30661.1 bacitracin ABC transporter ATP-binding protein [Virgibacillus profundi]PXY54833.1 ABC transporter ATP-binding protein [Virgibacillus profundi]
MSEVAMELVDVKKTIGKKEIIKGLSFTINKGEVFGFIGPNGAGKTTTIRMMVGLMQLTDGDVRILGNSIKTDFKKAIREVGAIVENPEMYPFMTGWQNLMHYSRMIPGITKERINEVIRLVGLEKPIKEKAGKYSLGMRQRLGIAQALLHSPSVLILDEPTNGLDPAGIREIRKYIRKLAEEENVAVIISSHLLSEIELMCDRIGIIKNGELVAIQDVKGPVETEKTNQNQVQMEVIPADKAIELLKEHHGIDAVLEDGNLAFQAEKESIPKMIQTLAKHEIAIYQVGVTKATLEDKFFDLIGENTIE